MTAIHPQRVSVRSNPVDLGRLRACPECDLLYANHALAPHQVARCQRCGGVVYEGPGASFDTTLALSATSLVLFILANTYPLLTLRLQGLVQTTSLAGAALALVREGMWELAVVVALTTIVIPLLEFAALLYVLGPLKAARRAPGAVTVFRWLETVRPWGMVEVYLLAVLVSVVKLASLATIEPGIALYAFSAMVFTAAGTVVTLDAEAVWQRLGAA